jgi:hypothetical protein
VGNPCQFGAATESVFWVCALRSQNQKTTKTVTMKGRAGQYERNTKYRSQPVMGMAPANHRRLYGKKYEARLFREFAHQATGPNRQNEQNETGFGRELLL